MQHRKQVEPLAVSCEPTALSDGLVHEFHGLTDADSRPIIPAIGDQLAE